MSALLIVRFALVWRMKPSRDDLAGRAGLLGTCSG